MKLTGLKLLALALFLLAGSMGFIQRSHAQKSQAATTFVHPKISNNKDSAIEAELATHSLPELRSLFQQQTEKTVEQTRKNIQVLKGLPDSQLFTVMNFIRTSLGVSCAYCHVNSGGDKWEWEKDDKPTKVTARKMMQMQFALNQGNKDIFGTTGGVTCYTCHRGQTKPSVMPSLPQPPPPGGAAGEAKPETAPLPTVDQVLDKYVQALGGEAGFKKLNTRVMKGAQITFDGTSIPLETYQAAPNKLVTIMTTPKQGVLMSGYNGTIAWSKTARGQRELSGAQLALMKRASDFYTDIKPRETFPNLTVVGREKIGDREAYVLTSKVSDTRTEKLYFDTQSGLLLRILAITQTVLAPIPEQTDFEDYRDVDGVRLPFTIRQSFVDPWVGWTRKYTEIKHNIAVDDAKFNPPPEPSTTPSPK
ncbi:MAG TPA: c-type cytochrome [Pyrinomonadaceae bacterium]